MFKKGPYDCTRCVHDRVGTWNRVSGHFSSVTHLLDLHRHRHWEHLWRIRDSEGILLMESLVSYLRS